MKNKILHILCEGQTEQGFADKVLKPYLQEHGVSSVKSTVIFTNKRKNAAGGMISYDQAYKELNILFKTYQDEEYSHHIFTTMFDYYALPTDLPDFTQARNIQDKYELIKKLESSFETAIDEQRFIPYIQLHEFESLVFCGLEFLKDIYPNCNKAINILSKTLNEFKNPELINHGTETAPSKRIIKAIESMCQTKYKYNKPKTGKYITGAIGIEALREKCPHFNEWIEKILNT